MEQKTFTQIYRITHAAGSGSCFYLKSKNIFITNYHVVRGFKSVAIHDNDNNPFLAEVVLVNPALDIALLAVDEDFSHLPELHLAEDNSLSVGNKVFVAGYPYGMPLTITEGSVSSAKQLMNGRHYVQTDAAVNPGNSGGPILNEKNEVVGITVSKFSEADNMGFAIRVETLRELLDSIEEIDRESFGVQCESCDDIIYEEDEYCPSCGEKLEENIFAERELSNLSMFCEDTIAKIGINPVLARDGYEYWTFYKGSSQIRLFIYDDTYLFCTSPINLLPKKNVEAVLDYILSEDLYPYKLGVTGRHIFIAYRVHLADLSEETFDEIQENICNLAQKADDLDDYFIEEFGCEYTEHSRIIDPNEN